jgi:hypothetical protein
MIACCSTDGLNFRALFIDNSPYAMKYFNNNDFNLFLETHQIEILFSGKKLMNIHHDQSKICEK